MNFWQIHVSRLNFCLVAVPNLFGNQAQLRLFDTVENVEAFSAAG